MNKVTTRAYDSADYIDSPEAVVAFLDAGSSVFVSAGLSHATRASAHVNAAILRSSGTPASSPSSFAMHSAGVGA